jgi:hypothetical protein
MAARTRGRRPTPDGRKVKAHEEAIRAAQSELLEAEREVDRKRDQLAEAVENAIDDSVATNVIGTWIVSPKKPDGISRQMVFKLLTRNDEKPSSNGNKAPKPTPRSTSTRKRPGPPGR